MAVEPKRACGYRKVGGLYLVSGSLSAPCGKLPFPVGKCPCCDQGIKPARGWAWINARKLFGADHCQDIAALRCGTCLMAGRAPDRAGLLWIGDRFYSAKSFMQEAAVMGVSRRINTVPHDLVVGETVVYMAHRAAIPPICDCQPDMLDNDLMALGDASFACPVHGEEPQPPQAAIVTAFIPQRVEIIVTDLQAQDADFMDRLTKRGLSAVVVPHDDPDHNPDA